MPLNIQVALISGFVAILVALGTSLLAALLKARSDLEAERRNELRRLYADVIEKMEVVFGKGELIEQAKLSADINLLLARLAIAAPDDVYLKVKEVLIDKGVVTGEKARPPIYLAMRRSIYGDGHSAAARGWRVRCKEFVLGKPQYTRLDESQMVSGVTVTHVAAAEVVKAQIEAQAKVKPAAEP